jgi:ABC-2 type transport system permease protein
LFIAITSTLLALIIAISAKEVFEAQTFSNFFRFPMLFLCGLFFPVASLPVFIRPLSYCLPLTYGVDMLNSTLTKNGTMSIWFDVIVLGGFSVLLFLVCLRNIQRKWIL